ncbi:N-acetyltransferase, partial [Mobiluncus mulieris]|nr:N-acetyltransferase [Mobiluncus mulieris]NMX12656.1 N-acetyltransferase [Mobiluncus mulieris]
FYEGFGFRLLPNERRMVMKSSSLLRITARIG